MKSEIGLTRITVITVCYNVASELELTIQSVLSQSYSIFEYIIVDGGSKDGSVDIIKKYEKHISRWISEPDKGVYDAMNKGIDLATGEWILFMNAGDTFYNQNVLKDVFEKRFDDSIGVIYGDVNLVFPSYGTILKKMDSLQEGEQPLSICHQASLTRTKYLKSIKFDLSYKIAADGNTFYKIWTRGLKFEYVSVCMANYEAVSGLSSTKFIQSFKERSRIIGRTWYNSLEWWIGYFKAFVKKQKRERLTNEQYEKQYFERISNKYC